jgi:hypothetical protein
VTRHLSSKCSKILRGCRAHSDPASVRAEDVPAMPGCTCDAQALEAAICAAAGSPWSARQCYGEGGTGQDAAGEIRCGVFRTGQRQESRQIRALVDSVARDVLNGRETSEPGRARLLATRGAVEQGWRAASELLDVQGYPDLALEVRRFVAQLPPVKTERELISEDLRKRIRAARVRNDAPTR